MIYPGGRWQTSVPGLAALSTAYVLSGTDDVLAHVWDRGLRRTAIPPLRHPPSNSKISLLAAPPGLVPVALGSWTVCRWGGCGAL